MFWSRGRPASLADASLPIARRGRSRRTHHLVHSLDSKDSKDFERLDAEAARAFGETAAEAGVQQNTHLGGLGSESDQLSSHLRGREVEGLLGEVGVEVAVPRVS